MLPEADRWAESAGSAEREVRSHLDLSPIRRQNTGFWSQPGGCSVRILHILGQRPDMTGSGMFLRNIWRFGPEAGDHLHLLCAGYADDDFGSFFGQELSTVRCGDTPDHEYPDLIPGMSDVMPYRSRRYADLSLDGSRAYLEAFGAQLAGLVESFSPDLIHIHHLWVLAGLVRQVDMPVVVTVHGTGLQQAQLAARHRDLFADALSEVALFMAVSDEVAHDTRRAYGLPAERVAVVANGFDEEVFFPPDEWAGGSQEPSLVAAGKYVEWKGFDHLIRSLARPELRDARLIILGTGPESRRDALLAEAEAAGVAERLSLPGHVPATEVAEAFRRSSVFVLPSLHEPFGLVLLEALACGAPVVASATAGPKLIVDPSLIEKGLAELVPPPADSSEPELDRYDADLAAALGRQVNRRVDLSERREIADSVNGLTWRATYRQMQALYTRLPD